MSSYLFKAIQPFQMNDLDTNGLYIVLWYVDKIPPHIGLLKANNYFSLKYNGVDMGIPFNKVLSLVEKKKCKTLIVSVQQEIELQEIQASFQSFEKAQAGKNTCLSPVKSLLCKEKQAEIKQLKDLLKTLEQHQQLGKVFSLNLNIENFELPYYTTKDIENRLIHLKDAERNTHTS